MSVVTGCHKSPSTQPIGDAEAPSIKAVALASITAKYSNVDTSKLILDHMSLETPPVGKKFISATFYLPSPAQTNTYDTPEGKRVKITTKGFGVVMSPSRRVQTVSEFPREDIYKVDQ